MICWAVCSEGVVCLEVEWVVCSVAWFVTFLVPMLSVSSLTIVIVQVWLSHPVPVRCRNFVTGIIMLRHSNYNASAMQLYSWTWMFWVFRWIWRLEDVAVAIVKPPIPPRFAWMFRFYIWPQFRFPNFLPLSYELIFFISKYCIQESRFFRFFLNFNSLVEINTYIFENIRLFWLKK